MNNNPYSIIYDLEERLAEWCGSKYCVCVESCCAAIFLSLQWKLSRYRLLSRKHKIEIPKFTYPGVVCAILHSGFKVKFTDEKWAGEYQLYPLGIYDAALRFKKGMYHGGMQCISMHIKKHLKVGRGGAILTNDKRAYEWLKLARFDGREAVPLLEQKDFKVVGWNAYLEPTQGARAIQLFEVLRSKHPEGNEDLKVEEQGYPDLSTFKIYTQ